MPRPQLPHRCRRKRPRVAAGDTGELAAPGGNQSWLAERFGCLAAGEQDLPGRGPATGRRGPRHGAFHGEPRGSGRGLPAPFQDWLCNPGCCGRALAARGAVATVPAGMDQEQVTSRCKSAMRLSTERRRQWRVHARRCAHTRAGDTLCLDDGVVILKPACPAAEPKQTTRHGPAVRSPSAFSADQELNRMTAHLLVRLALQPDTQRRKQTAVRLANQALVEQESRVRYTVGGAALRRVPRSRSSNW